MDTSAFPKFSVSAFVCRDTQKQHFNIDWTPSPIIDTFQMMLLLLVEWPLHPLTLGQTFLLNHPQRREVGALKELGKLRQAALSLHGAAAVTYWHQNTPWVQPFSPSSLVIAGEMFVDDRILTLFKRNAHHTLTYWSVFFSFGLCIAFLGPTILDLQCQTNSTLSQITWVFFSQQFCLLIGSSIGGIFKRT